MFDGNKMGSQNLRQFVFLVFECRRPCGAVRNDMDCITILPGDGSFSFRFLGRGCGEGAMNRKEPAIP